MVLAHGDRTVALVFSQTLLAQRATMAMTGKLKAIGDLRAILLLKPTALSAALAGRTDGSALLNGYLEIFNAEASILFRRWLRRANELSAFGLSLRQTFG